MRLVIDYERVITSVDVALRAASRPPRALSTWYPPSEFGPEHSKDAANAHEDTRQHETRRKEKMSGMAPGRRWPFAEYGRCREVSINHIPS